MSTSRVLGLMIASAWLVAGCNGAKKIDVGGTCILNSDCGGSFVCTWGICHVACHASADCPKGQSCIIASVPIDGVSGAYPCTYNSDCQTGLICAVDRQCRQQCQKNVDCTNGQTCTTTNTCAEQSQVDSNKNLLVPDGGLAARVVLQAPAELADQPVPALMLPGSSCGHVRQHGRHGR